MPSPRPRSSSSPFWRPDGPPLFRAPIPLLGGIPMEKTTRATVADLLAEKGKRQLVQIFCATPDEAAAAHAAGIDIIGTEEQFVTPAFREAAGSTFITAGLIYGAHINADEYIRAGFKAMNAGADAVYSASSVGIIARMYAEGLPVVGHVGLIP